MEDGARIRAAGIESCSRKLLRALDRQRERHNASRTIRASGCLDSRVLPLPQCGWIIGDLRGTTTALEAAKVTGINDQRLFAFPCRQHCAQPKRNGTCSPNSSRHSGVKRNPGRAPPQANTSGLPETIHGATRETRKPHLSSSPINPTARQQHTPRRQSSLRSERPATREENRLFRSAVQRPGYAGRTLPAPLRRMSLRLSRRPSISNRAERLDLRRSIRRSIAHGGELIDLAYKGRKPRKKARGSSRHQRLDEFLQLVSCRGLLTRCSRASSVSIRSSSAPRLVEVTDLLHTRHLQEALRRLSQRAAGWSGGTKIGESLRQFNRLHGRKLLSRETVFIILSDGWDTGEPELLAAQLRTARRRAQRILWLNPLLGLKDYQPLTRGMAAALPHVDVFAPAHNLESLLALEHHL